MFKPTFHCPTHCQAAQAYAKTKAWQRVCMSHRTPKPTDNATDEKEHRTGNRRLVQWRLKWLIGRPL